jgi:molybdopterin/thiamine biosynthesis adenylyltransferase
MLTRKELGRYHRQIIFPDFDETGQEKLKNSHVLIAGIGGLGSLSSTYLARAGVGHITIVDNNHVELSDLNRQILYDEENIGERKVDSAHRRLSGINPHIKITPIFAKIQKENVLDMVEGAQVVVDGLDNFETRFLLNSICVEENIPFIYGGIDELNGAITTIIPNKTPCLACLFKGSPKEEKDFLPVFGFVPGFIACLQSMEAIKLPANIGIPLAGKLFLFDGKTGEFLLSNVNRDSKCSACGKTSNRRLNE